ncbi:hypothetical protein X777_08098 [Ooceraea biroi]|uniref:Uncharacterized protein n=1 Tax=Ooceraea biroi TaxID=2015173 RepID=A0A026W9B1_OOCBI|nr:hypothetical protein X777_08098 [Ooceraea biroi]
MRRLRTFSKDDSLISSSGSTSHYRDSLRHTSRRETALEWRREEGRESVGRRVTRGGLEKRLRRVFLASSVRSTPRTQSANECRLVSQLILPHPQARERERMAAGEASGQREVGKSLPWKARTPYPAT